MKSMKVLEAREARRYLRGQAAVLLEQGGSAEVTPEGSVRAAAESMARTEDAVGCDSRQEHDRGAADASWLWLAGDGWR